MSFTSFAEMRRSSNFDELKKEMDRLTTSSFEKKTDDRIWKVSMDKAGNGSAVIRFLPAPKGEKWPWVRVWSHGFQGPTGKWYIENSLSTLNQPDPVSELNSQLWNSGIESNKDIVRKQKRRTDYYANILVVKDPANPQNEGKVFIFKFGKKIFDKIKDLMNPQFEDEKPVDPFNFWEGCNFKLRIRRVEGYANYDKSEFSEPSPLSDDNDYIEGIWNQQHSLSAFIDPSNFKTYDELKSRLESVLKPSASGSTFARLSAEKSQLTDPDDEMYVKSAVAASSNAAPKPLDDDMESFFEGLK